MGGQAWASEVPDEAEVVPDIETRVRAPMRTTASEEHLDQEAIRRIPKRTAEDALRLVPGIVLDQHGGEGKARHFLIRGFDAMHGADFEVTLEGIPLNEWSNIHGQGYLDLGFITPEMIEGIAVEKGPFSLEQGPFSMAGSARYRLGVAPQELGLTMSYGLGTSGPGKSGQAIGRHRFLAAYAPESGAGEDLLSFEVLSDEGFGPARQTQRVSGLGKKVLFRSSRHGQLSGIGALYSAEFGLPGVMRLEDVQAGRRGFFDVYEESGRGSSERQIGGLVYERYWAGGRHEAVTYTGHRSLDIRENFTGYLVDPVDGDRRRQAQAQWSVGGHTIYEQDLWSWLGLHVGGGARVEWLDQVEEQLSARDTPLDELRAWRGRQTLAHLLAGVSLRPTGSWRIGGGLRLDGMHAVPFDEAGGEPGSQWLMAYSPRVTTQWGLLEGLDLFGAYGRGVRPPEAVALSGAGEERGRFLGDRGSATSVMTRADAFEAGARLRPHPGLSVSLTGFATFIERESVYDHLSGLTLDLDATRRLGAELALGLRPAPLLEVRADMTYVNASFVASENPVPMVPPLAASLLVMLGDGPGPGAALRLGAIAPRPLPLGARSRARITLDGTAYYAFGRLRLDLEVENVLDQALYDGEYYFASRWQTDELGSYLPAIHYVAAAPRTLRVGVTTRF